MKPSVGRIVQVKILVQTPGGPSLVWRPAQITTVLDEEIINAKITLDSALDGGIDLKETGILPEDYLPGHFAHISACSQGDCVGCWRWPPRV